MAADKEAVVLSFLNMFDGGAWPDFDKLVSMFADECECYVVYPTTPPVTTRDALKEELERQAKDSANPEVDVKAIASKGNTVFVERVDSFLTHGKPLTICINSVFEVNDAGKITAWREYMDPTTTLKQLGISYDDMQKLLEG